MRFRFCGDLDAPDWLLQEIAVLSKISSVRIKLLVAQVVNSLMGTPIDFEKVAKLTKDANFEVSDVKAVIAGLEFVIRNAAKYDCDDGTLCNELQQLGLPKEHSEACVRPYREKKDDLRARFYDKTLRLNTLEKVDWRVDYIIGSSANHDQGVPSLQMQLSVREPAPFKRLLDEPGVARQPGTGETHNINFEATPAKLRVLIHELQAARQLMGSIE